MFDYKNYGLKEQEKGMTDKATPQKAKEINESSLSSKETKIYQGKCPVCGDYVYSFIGHNYCVKCGQAIDWSWCRYG